MTKLEEIEARWAKVTPGPWRRGSVDAGNGRSISACTSRNGIENEWIRVSTPSVYTPQGNAIVTNKQRDADAEAIAHAPQDVAALLAEVRRLREQIAVALTQVMPGTDAGAILSRALGPSPYDLEPTGGTK